MNKLKIIFKKIKFKLFALFGLLTIFGGCLLSNNSYAWFVNDEGNLQSSNLCDNTDIYFNQYNNLIIGKISHLDSGIYTLSIGNGYSGINRVVKLLDSSLSEVSANVGTFNNGLATITISNTISNCYLLIAGGTYTSKPQVMLNQGSTALSYEPYGKVYYNYQFVSPWKVNSEGNLESSNLFNAPNTEIINDTENNSDVAFQFYKDTSEVFNVGNFFTTTEPAYIYYNVFRNLEVGKTYTLSISNYPYFSYEALLDDDNYYKTNNGVLTLTLTEDLKNYDDWRFVIIKNTPAIFGSFTIMINEGTIPFAYAPYGKVYFSNNQAANLQAQLNTLQDKYNLLEANYNDLSASYNELHIDYDSANSELNEYLDTIHQLNGEVATLTQLTNDLRTQVESNFTWQNLFFTMADTPFRVVANALGFNIFGINLFATFIGLTTTLAIIFLVKKFI